MDKFARHHVAPGTSDATTSVPVNTHARRMLELLSPEARERVLADLAATSRPRATLPYNGMAPAVAGSATSEAAAKAIEPKRLSKRQRVYGYILSCGAHGATRPEIADALDMSENTVRPRVCELYATWNWTHGCPDVKEHPSMTREGCAVLLAAPFYREAADAWERAQVAVALADPFFGGSTNAA